MLWMRHARHMTYAIFRIKAAVNVIWNFSIDWNNILTLITWKAGTQGRFIAICLPNPNSLVGGDNRKPPDEFFNRGQIIFLVCIRKDSSRESPQNVFRFNFCCEFEHPNTFLFKNSDNPHDAFSFCFGFVWRIASSNAYVTLFFPKQKDKKEVVHKSVKDKALTFVIFSTKLSVLHNESKQTHEKSLLTRQPQGFHFIFYSREY